MPKKLKVYFVYRKSKLPFGSTVMRAHYLRNIADAVLGDKYDFEILRMPADNVPGLQRAWVASCASGGVYFLTKACTNKLSPSNALRLQKKAAGVCFDHVDSDLRYMPMVGGDIHLCCSYAQKTALERIQTCSPEIGGKAMLLLHNVDERLYGMRFPLLNELKAVYCGDPGFAYFTDRILRGVDILEVITTSEMENSIGLLPRYNFHYCIRKPEEPEAKIYKPFTKGFTAAVCKSNVIVNRQVPDALEFLGEDYPYLVRGLDEEEIIETLARARANFGGDEWCRARRIMESVEEKISPQALAGQIEDILSELGVSQA